MSIPHTYTTRNTTGCCAIPNTGQWERKVVSFEGARFIRGYSRRVFGHPVGVDATLEHLRRQAARAGATMPPQDALILSRDLSAWRTEHLYAVTMPIHGADNVTLSGTFATLVFEGPEKGAAAWKEEAAAYARQLGTSNTEVSFFHTACHDCQKRYGRNYVIAFARLAPAASTLPRTLKGHLVNR